MSCIRRVRRRRFFYPLDFAAMPYPPGTAPAFVPGKPVCPLTGQWPDRLLFSTRAPRSYSPALSARPVYTYATMTATERTSTLGGIFAILLWSTSIAFSRALTESFGVFSAGAYAFLLAGVIGTARILLTRKAAVAGVAAVPGVSAMPRAYLACCGALFVAYQLSLYLALGLAAGGPEVVEVGIINYLWPVLTLLFSIPILKTRARWWVVPGFALALSGTVLATANSLRLPAAASAGAMSLCSPLPYLALVAAVTWALYSNLARKQASSHEGDAVPFFFLASGSLMLLLSFIFREQVQCTVRGVLTLGYMALFPNLIAYTLWDKAIRRGDVILVTVLSYFIPLLSTVVTCLRMEVFPGWNVWLACVLLIAGALLSRWSLKT